MRKKRGDVGKGIRGKVEELGVRFTGDSGERRYEIPLNPLFIPIFSCFPKL